jgi:5'-3' exonuclease
MGIPKFAKWLIHRYPTILKKIKNDQDVPEIGRVSIKNRQSLS